MEWGRQRKVIALNFFLGDNAGINRRPWVPAKGHASGKFRPLGSIVHVGFSPILTMRERTARGLNGWQVGREGDGNILKGVGWGTDRKPSTRELVQVLGSSTGAFDEAALWLFVASWPTHHLLTLFVVVDVCRLQVEVWWSWTVSRMKFSKMLSRW